MTPSPKMRTTVPSKCSIASHINFTAGWTKSIASSGSMPATDCVEPTISANKTVACLRSWPLDVEPCPWLRSWRLNRELCSFS